MTGRRNLHENSPSDSLLKLQSDLRKAYVLKSLEAQIAEKRAQRVAENIQDRISADLINVTDRSLLMEQQRQLQERSQYKTDLQEQILEKNAKKLVQLEEEKSERKVLIAADHEQEAAEQLEKLVKKRLQLEFSTQQQQLHQETRALLSDMKVERERVQDDRIRSHQIKVQDRDAKLEKMKKALEARRSEVMEAVARNLMEHEPKWERCDVLVELTGLEMRQEAEVQALEDQLRRESASRELALGLKEQMAFERECRQRFEAREKAFADGVMSRVMESERMERLTEEVRRRRRAQYREDLKSMGEVRRRARDEELARIAESSRAEEQRQQVSAAREREDRMRLLAEHADNVGDFLNREMLTREEERVLEKMRGDWP